MSKRYREVLEEVETPTTRAATRAASLVAATEVDAVAEAPEAPEAGSAVVDHDGVGGGVAMLVRPPVVAADAPPEPLSAPPAAPRPGLRADLRPDSRSDPRAPRPGNGPADAEEPLAFAWRGRRYEVTRILGHWREEEGWWRRPDGEPIRIEQSDLWRVEATRDAGSVVGSGVYELARRGTTWRLDRVWD